MATGPATTKITSTIDTLGAQVTSSLGSSGFSSAIAVAPSVLSTTTNTYPTPTQSPTAAPSRTPTLAPSPAPTTLPPTQSPTVTPTSNSLTIDASGQISGYNTQWNPYVGLGAAIFGVCLISCGVYGRHRYKQRQKVELDEANKGRQEEEGDEEDHQYDPPSEDDRDVVDPEAPKGVVTGTIGLHRTTEIIVSSADDEVDDELAPMHTSIKPVARIKPQGEDPLRPLVIVTDGRLVFCYQMSDVITDVAWKTLSCDRASPPSPSSLSSAYQSPTSSSITTYYDSTLPLTDDAPAVNHDGDGDDGGDDKNSAAAVVVDAAVVVEEPAITTPTTTTATAPVLESEATASGSSVKKLQQAYLQKINNGQGQGLGQGPGQGSNTSPSVPLPPPPSFLLKPRSSRSSVPAVPFTTAVVNEQERQYQNSIHTPEGDRVNKDKDIVMSIDSEMDETESNGLFSPPLPAQRSAGDETVVDLIETVTLGETTSMLSVVSTVDNNAAVKDNTSTVAGIDAGAGVGADTVEEKEEKTTIPSPRSLSLASPEASVAVASPVHPPLPPPPQTPPRSHPTIALSSSSAIAGNGQTMGPQTIGTAELPPPPPQLQQQQYGGEQNHAFLDSEEEEDSDLEVAMDFSDDECGYGA